MGIAESAERPVGRRAGSSAARERRWGLVGGTAGALAGCGSALVATVIDGAPWQDSGLYPAIFREPRILATDVYLLMTLLAGLGFSIAALVAARVSAYPRSDGYGAGLVGALLSALAGSILFLRVLALTRGL